MENQPSGGGGLWLHLKFGYKHKTTKDIANPRFKSKNKTLQSSIVNGMIIIGERKS